MTSANQAAPAAAHPAPHPALPELEYVRPASLAEASAFLLEHAGEARPLLGGTDIFVRMRDGFWKDKYLVDVKGLDGMRQILFHPSTGLTLGAAVNMNRTAADPVVLSHYPLLAEAARTVASYALRTRATVVGNICNASPAGDTTGACLLLDGVLAVHGVDGLRREPLKSFFLGPGRTVLNPGDIVIAIYFPLPPQGAAGCYLKLGRNQASDLAIVGVTAYGAPDPGLPSGYRIRLALASVAPVPLEVFAVEALLGEAPLSLEALQAAALLARDACQPIDDVRGSARYRHAMVRNLSLRALRQVAHQLDPHAVPDQGGSR
jgi:CO/xanthine dehydrogenase FAD-binding subunit